MIHELKERLEVGSSWRVSENFRATEFACSHCGKLGVTLDLVNTVQTIRHRMGAPIYISSGHRCYLHPIEARKKAGAYQTHARGIGVDLFCPALGLKAIVDWATRMPLVRGIGYNPWRGFVHVDLFDQRPVGSDVLTMWDYDEDGKVGVRPPIRKATRAG